MASPVDTSVKFYHSAQAGAPVLTGAVGSLISLLDATIVNGFGLQSASSLSVLNGVATLTFAQPHAAQVDSVILVAGATSMTDLNGEQKVTAVSNNTISFATTLANGTAAGTITAKLAGANWAKAFAGTNLAVYRSNDVTTNRRFVRVADTAQYDSRVVVYENMTAVSTGTGPMPTSSQANGGAVIRKQTNTGSVADPLVWAVFATSKRVIISIHDYPGYVGGPIYGFGDFPSFKSGDVYNTFLTAGSAPGNVIPALIYLDYTASNNGMWAQRSHTNAAGAVTAGKWVLGSGDSYAGNGTAGPFPAPIGGGLFLQPSLITAPDKNAQGLRGRLPGIWQTPQMISPSAFQQGDIVVGAGATAGRRLFVLQGGPGSGSSTWPGTFVDITGPWE